MKANLASKLMVPLGDLFDYCLDRPVRATTATTASFPCWQVGLGALCRTRPSTDLTIIPKDNLKGETGEPERGMACVGKDPIAMAASQ